MQALHAFDALARDIRSRQKLDPANVRFHRVWSYGDVEANGVYYHPNRTNYAHQAFEEYFWRETGLYYSDLSGLSSISQQRRAEHEPPVERMTFPVLWLHQLMLQPMGAGEAFGVAIDTVDLGPDDVGVRAWISGDESTVVGVVIWHRVAVSLVPRRQRVPIPSWFPRVSLAS